MSKEVTFGSLREAFNYWRTGCRTECALNPSKPVLVFDRIHASADPLTQPDAAEVKEFIRIISRQALLAIGDKPKPGCLQLSQIYPDSACSVTVHHR
jgi:hypothetical protein